MTAVKEALEWLYQQPLGKSDYTLEHVKNVLAQLGNPHLSKPVIHVAGTNGKGSTVAFIKRVLNEHGLKVVTYTSPHIYQFNERMMCDEQMISDAAIVSYINVLKAFRMTQFEYMTCLFFLYMADQQADVAVIEVGIGGLHDTTNVVSSEISVITTIGLDHQAFLGETLADIARQKAGIIKWQKPVVVGHVADSLVTLFQDMAFEKKATLYLYGDQFMPEQVTLNAAKHNVFTYDGVCYEMTLKGKHQVANAVVALKACQLYLNERFNSDLAKRAIQETRWAGRFETVRQHPLIVVDGAHNEEGILALLQTMAEQFDGQSVKVLFGALSRKDYAQMIALLSREWPLYISEFDHPQSIQLDTLTLPESVHVVSDWKHWLMQQTEPVVVTGSLYFISQVKEFVEKERA